MQPVPEQTHDSQVIWCTPAIAERESERISMTKNKSYCREPEIKTESETETEGQYTQG